MITRIPWPPQGLREVSDCRRDYGYSLNTLKPGNIYNLCLFSDSLGFLKIGFVLCSKCRVITEREKRPTWHRRSASMTPRGSSPKTCVCHPTMKCSGATAKRICWFACVHIMYAPLFSPFENGRTAMYNFRSTNSIIRAEMYVTKTLHIVHSLM